EPRGDVPPHCQARGQDSERRQARRASGRATDEVRVARHPPDGEGAGAHDSADAAAASRRGDQVTMLDQRGQLLRAATGFAGCSMLSYDRALWALRSWLDSWSGIGRIAVGMAHQGFGWRVVLWAAATFHELQ